MICVILELFDLPFVCCNGSVVYRGHNDDRSLMMMIMTLKVTVTIEDTNDYGLVTKTQSVDY